MESTKTCPKCGFQAELDKRFCTNCGAEFEEAYIEAAAEVTETNPTQQIKTNPTSETPIRCSRCGERVLASEKICASCGNELEAPLVAPISEPTNKCIVCKAEVPRVNKFCNRCGADMKQPTEREAFTGNPFMQAGGTPLSQGSSGCRFCGTEMKPGAAFCPRCGNANQSANNYNYNTAVPRAAYNGNSGLVYGILSIVFGILGGWLAIVFGIYGIITAKKSGSTPTLVLSIIGLCLIPFSIFFWAFIFMV